MPQETLYRPKGAGHNVPGERREYVKPRDRLVEAFGKWIRTYKNEPGMEHPRNYKVASGLVPDMGEVGYEEINSLLCLIEDDPELMLNSGVMISALYNHLGSKDIVYECDTGTEITYLGCSLPEWKRLIIDGNTGFSAAFSSNGPVINYGPGNDLAASSGGLVVNYGEIQRGIGWWGKGPVVNFGKCLSLGWKTSGLVINESGAENLTAKTGASIFINLSELEDCLDSLRKGSSPRTMIISGRECREIPGLVEYIFDLKDSLGPEKPKEDVFRALDDLDVESDIRRILTEAGRLEA